MHNTSLFSVSLCFDTMHSSFSLSELEYLLSVLTHLIGWRSYMGGWSSASSMAVMPTAQISHRWLYPPFFSTAATSGAILQQPITEPVITKQPITDCRNTTGMKIGDKRNRKLQLHHLHHPPSCDSSHQQEGKDKMAADESADS